METAIRLAAAVLAVALLPHHATKPHWRHYKHHHECHTARCAHFADKAWARLHPSPRRAVDASESTGEGTYSTVPNSTCYHEGSTTSAGVAPYVGEVASNSIPLGTRIRLSRPVFGLRTFVVLDHIGWGSELDIYGPSEAACNEYGREQIGVEILGR